VVPAAQAAEQVRLPASSILEAEVEVALVVRAEMVAQ
jgi:hypothetical protein